MSKALKRLASLCAMVLMGAGAASAQTAAPPPSLVKFAPPGINIQDPYVAAWYNLTPDLKPRPLIPGQEYGMDPATGRFVFPKASPEVHEGQRFPGEMANWDQNSYSKNVDLLSFTPGMSSSAHVWVNAADFGGHRYLYIHYRYFMRVLDVTDPRNVKIVYVQGPVLGPKGWEPALDPWNVKDYFGGSTIAWSEALHKPIIVTSYEVGRYGLFADKTKEPDKVAMQRHYSSLKGFKVYVMNGPLPTQWQLIATRTTDYKHPDAPIGQQQGSGSLDAPEYFGGKYMFLSSAPDDSYALTEYPNYLYSPGFQAWDMSNPADPKFLSQITVPGQVVGNKADADAYLMNPRAGNRTSWMGSRMPLFLPKPVEKGGHIGFGAMGGLGLYIFDISDPAHPKTLSHLDTPPHYAGTEFDNVDVSQYERTGYVFTNGYPMNRDCYEPYKDIFVIDAKDPTHPRVAAVLPEPVPPKEATFTDYCQRGGDFGPKRSNAVGQPGTYRQGVVPYAFYSAGVQIFDVKDPAHPSIAGYYVPRMGNTSEVPAGDIGINTLAIFTEYDRNIIWAFTESGVYALSTPLLGAPVIGEPAKPFPG